MIAYSLSRAASLPGRSIEFAQPLAVAVEPARLARPQQRRVDQPPLVDALAVAAEDQAARRAMTSPCQRPSASVAEQVEPLGGAVRGLDRAVRVGVEPGRQRAGDRRLLDDIGIADLAGQRLQPAALHPRLLQQVAQIVAGALAAVMLGEDRIAQRRIEAIGLERRVVLQIDRLGVAALQPVERRLRDVEKPLFDQRSHLAEEEGQQQRADVAAVDIGVGHDDDAVIARLVGVEILAADAGAERLDQRADLGRATASCRSGRARH